MKNDLKLLLRNAKLLLVEDNVQIRKEFRDVLSLYIGTVYEADSGRSALRFFQDQKINIIFSDVKMPDIDGLTFIKEVRKIDSSIPVVVISAYSEPEELIEFIELSLVQYAVKPITHTKLIDILERCAKILEEKSLLFFDLGDDSHYDRNQNRVYHNDAFTQLTTKERLLLELLIDNHGTLVSKEMIQYDVYGDKPMSDAALKNLVLKLRRKIRTGSLETVGSAGYLLRKR